MSNYHNDYETEIEAVNRLKSLFYSSNNLLEDSENVVMDFLRDCGYYNILRSWKDNIRKTL